MEEFKIPINELEDIPLNDRELENFKSFLDTNKFLIGEEKFKELFSNWLVFLNDTYGCTYIATLPFFLLYIGIEFRNKVNLEEIELDWLNYKTPMAFMRYLNTYKYFGGYSK